MVPAALHLPFLVSWAYVLTSQQVLVRALSALCPSSRTMSDAPGPAVDAALAKLRHLDLEGCLSNRIILKEACGGYSDVYVATLSRRGGCGVVKVAIKSLRICFRDDQSLKKVATSSNKI